MSKFLSLTHVHYQSRKQEECLVNLDTITFITRHHLHAGKWYEPYINPEGVRLTREVPTPEQDVTCISFAAGMHEETESIYVAESLDTILRNS